MVKQTEKILEEV